ncbi:unnamed protein product [Rhizoctonia solani]|uniref:Uncharacterized protein n=1 Tax=Rhizoctonia solani TaxID=456999 RepID=A0A8H3DJ84_9AGAM|nr:unnamed protein product [Rhizoctonia solani]CAE6528528.1 unnamed protein product [Rhizoctonia solani]
MPPNRRLNNIIARANTIRSSTLLRNSSVPAEVFSAQALVPATNTQVINPTDAGYRLGINVQATEPVQLPTRKPFNLIYGPRPVGTAGREDFPLKELLGLSTYEYLVCLKTMRNDEHRLYHAYNKFIEALPEFKGFPDRYWAPRAIMYVSLKSSSEAWRRNNPETAAARSAARAMEKAALKAAALAKKVKRPRGRPKGKGKAKSQSVTPRRATIESSANNFDEIADNFDEIADNFGNMSLEPDIAAGLANMSVDAGADEEDDLLGQPFFHSTHSLTGGTSTTGPYATSTPLAPARLPAQDVGSSSYTTIGNNIGQSTVGANHAPAPSLALSHTYMPHSTIDINRGTHEYVQVTGISNHPNIVPARAQAFDYNHTLSSSSRAPLIPHSSRPPPIPHSSRPPSAYSNSFSLSAPPNSRSLLTPAGSRDPTPSPNTSYGGTQGINYARTAPDPGPVVYLDLSRSLSHSQAPLAHLPTNSASHDAPTRSRDATPRLVSAHSTNTSRTEAARPVVVDLASHMQAPFAQKAGRVRTDYHASSHPRAPASIVTLSGTSPYTQAAEESNTHPVAAFDDGELSDAPSATASNKPVDSDVDIAATATVPKKAPKKNSKTKAQSAHPDEERPEEQPETGAPRGRGRGRGRSSARARARGRGEHHGHIEDPSLDDNHTHEEDNSRGRGRGRGRAGRARGGSRARGGARAQGASGVDAE